MRVKTRQCLASETQYGESCLTGENEFSEEKKTCFLEKPPYWRELPDRNK